MIPYDTLFTRHPANPLLSAKDWPYSMNSVFNPGATLLQDGTTLLLCRIEDRRGLSHLCAARSKNGVDNWQIDKDRLDERCGVSDWVIHDLRRTGSTGMGDIGIQPHVVEAVLNHVSGSKAGVAGTYNKAMYLKEKREALNKYAEYVLTIVS